MSDLNKYLKQFESLRDEDRYGFYKSVPNILADMNACTDFWDSFDKVVEKTKGLIAIKFDRSCWSLCMTFVFDSVAGDYFDVFCNEVLSLFKGCYRVNRWIDTIERVGVKGRGWESYPESILNGAMPVHQGAL